GEVEEWLAGQARGGVAGGDDYRELHVMGQASGVRGFTSLVTHDPCPLTHDGVSNFLLRRKFAGLVLQHHRYAVADRVAETARLAYEFARRLAVDERPLADRAHQYVEEPAIHWEKISLADGQVFRAGAARVHRTVHRSQHRPAAPSACPRR